MKRIFTVLILLLSVTTFAQDCGTGFSELIIRIDPDNWPYEVSWEVVNSETGANIGSGINSASDTLCIEANSCVLFRIHDSFGDGIVSPGGYWVYLDGVEVAHFSGDFNNLAEHSIACDPGTFCSSSIPLTEGDHTATFEDSWYSFSPVLAGMYNVNTCSTNSCDTKIWIYEGCPGTLTLSEFAEGTYAYNDNADCGLQAHTNVMMLPGHTYYLRIGDNAGACNGDINFSFHYNGPIIGCTDIESCNYNPLATADDGSCIYFPNPLCQGPDLQFDSLAFVNSLSLQTHNAGNCDITEGCVTGTGLRNVITFTSKINNVGPQDYYIGNPSTQPGMFSTVNCHGHTHYEGYGDYRLYDMAGNTLPVGHKNGFCVMDLCGFGQYGCGDMGISAGCYDEYGAGTQCQWIDITDIPDGDYRLAVIVNSLHRPDALGRNEMNYVNNALQVCINITRVNGVPTFDLLPSCTPFSDCNGIPGGSAVADCDGVCNGSSMYGNALVDGFVNMEDIGGYMELLATDAPVATGCTDLDGNGGISIYDVASDNWCLKNQVLNPNSSCNWPRNILNPTDTVGLAIANVNFTANYVDIEIKNPRCEVMAYQFGLSGINITDVVSLSYPPDMPVQAGFNAMRSEVFTIYTGDSVLARFISPQDLIRVYFDHLTDSMICIKSIVDVVNDYGQRTVTEVYGNCVAVPVNPDGFAGVSERTHLTIMPNPANETAFVNIPQGFENRPSWTLFDAMGRRVKEVNPSNGSNANMIQVDINELKQGVYFLRLTTADGKSATGRLVKG